MLTRQVFDGRQPLLNLILTRSIEVEAFAIVL